MKNKRNIAKWRFDKLNNTGRAGSINFEEFLGFDCTQGYVNDKNGDYLRLFGSGESLGCDGALRLVAAVRSLCNLGSLSCALGLLRFVSCLSSRVSIGRGLLTIWSLPAFSVMDLINSQSVCGKLLYNTDMRKKHMMLAGTFTLSN